MKKAIFILILLNLQVLKAETNIQDSLTIFVYPPRHELDWSSPRKVLESFLGIEIGKKFHPGHDIVSVNPWGEPTTISSNYRSTMGHTIAHVNCTNSDGTRFDDWSSFSGQDYTAVDKKNTLKDKIGLGTLFYDYIDGHIIRGDENVNRVIYYKGETRNGVEVKPRYMQFEITPDRCDELKKMATFFESFHYNKNTELNTLLEREPVKVLYFTTNLDPYKSYQDNLANNDAKVGGGCAPYAVGLLKAAGLYDKTLDSIFKIELDVSEKLIGSSKNKVNFASLFIGKNGRHWTYEGYPNRHMSQYDPQKIWNFVGGIEECLNSDQCNLESNSWYQANKGVISKGRTIKLTNKESNESREVEGLLIKMP